MTETEHTHQSFPKGFMWGNSTSSMQTEGAWNEGGKGMSVYDIRSAGPDKSDWKVAIDDYHRYPEDFDLMQKMGMNCYRFQISWSRVQPDGEGAFNEEGIAFYSKFVDELLARGITPMACLYHFDMPLALAEKYNGFLSREVVDDFVKFGIEMVKRLGDRVKYWITFNEQNLYFGKDADIYAGNLNGAVTRDVPYQICHHVMMAHAQVANYIHAHTDCKIGGMLAYSQMYPASSKPLDVEYARRYQEFSNFNQLRAFAEGKYSTEVMTFVRNNNIDMDIQPGDLEELNKLRSDFIAFSYYTSWTLDADSIPEGTPPNEYNAYGTKKNPNIQYNEWGWGVDPLGLRNILNTVYSRYHIPMFPVENGLGVREEYDGQMIEDDYRIAYLQAHIQAVKDAVFEDGVHVLGYLGWGLIDIPSSQGNMDKRYGVVYVNRTNHDLKDMKRIPKKSFYWLTKVIQSNGAQL